MKYLIAFFFLSIFAACSKHAGDFIPPAPKASVTLASPFSQQVFGINDSVAISGLAIASETIHGYELTIKRTGDTTVLYSKHIHDHNDTLFIQQKWKAELPSATNLQLEIKLILDHSGNVFEKKQSFRVE